LSRDGEKVMEAKKNASLTAGKNKTPA